MGNGMLSNSTYDRLKEVTQLWLPASGSLYFGLSQIWGWPNGEQVVGSLALFTTFFGVVLRLSNKGYQEQNDGDIVVERDPSTGKTIFGLEYNGDVDEIPGKDRIVFSVVDKNDQFWEDRN